MLLAGQTVAKRVAARSHKPLCNCRGRGRRHTIRTPTSPNNMARSSPTRLRRSSAPLPLLLALLLASCASPPQDFSRGGAQEQGIVLRPDADILFGSPSICNRPATVDLDQLRASTPEWQKIQRDSIDRGSARYALLVDKMRTGLKARIQSAAMARDIDLVVAADDIVESNGLMIVDLTAEVLKQQP